MTITTTTVPDQAMRALRLANEVRAAKARLKAELAAMEFEDAAHRLASIIVEPQGAAASSRLDELILALPRTGPVTLDELRRHAGMSTCTVRLDSARFTSRQREALAFALRNWRALFPCSRRTRYSITLPQRDVLEFLSQYTRPVPASTVAEALVDDPSAVGGRLRILESKGLVGRCRLTSRVSGWTLTADGRGAVQ